MGQTPGTTGVNAGDTLRGWAEMELDTGFTNVEAMGILAYFAGATYLSYSQFYVAEGRGVLVDRGSKISIIADPRNYRAIWRNRTAIQAVHQVHQKRNRCCNMARW